MRKTFKAALLVSSALIATPVLAQQQPTPPEHYTLNAQGVDLVQGTFNYSTADVVIGQPGQGGLVHGRVWANGGWRDTLAGTIKVDGPVYIVSLGGMSEAFVKSGSTFTPVSNTGASLSQSGTSLTFTAADGAQAIYSTVYSGSTSAYSANNAALMEIVSPNGERTTYEWEGVTYCSLREESPDPDEPGECIQWRNAVRLDSVRNNFGYQINFIYASNTPPDDIYGLRAGWLRRTDAIGVNLAVDYCAPTAQSCSTTRTWPKATYASGDYGGSITSVTDQSGRTTSYSYSSGRLSGVQEPGMSSNIISVAYDGTGKVSSVTDPSGTWNYTYSDVGTTRTTVATLNTTPTTQQVTAVSDMTIGRATSVKNALNETWAFQYDSQYRLERTTQPEGGYQTYAYDGFGNLTTTVAYEPSGSTSTAITVSSAYPASCANTVLCHRPLSTTDGRGNTTDYTWDSVHGGLLTATGPVPATGEARPQTRYTYAAQNAWFKNSAGTIVQSPNPVVLPTAVSACATGTSCTGAANEVKSTVTYGPTFGSGTANNLLPTSMSSGSGNGSLTATTAMAYTANGDLLSVNGPLTGSGDLTGYRYDSARQLVGVVGPDPDGGGPLLNRAQRLIRNARGLVTLVEAGTTPGYSDANWASFVTLQRQATTYDAMDRPVRAEDQTSAGTTLALTQLSYNAAGQLECSAQRMNILVFGSLPSSACSLGTQGYFGPDRIMRAAFDNAGRLSATTAAYGTAAASTETATYTDNGQIETLTDGEGNRSTFEYDGFSRMVKLRYPSPTTPGVSSTSDYEAYGYDRNGNVTSTRSRANQTFTATYDALNRIRTIDAPAGTADTYYGYDNLGRTTRVSDAASGGNQILMTWDALGRMLTQGGVGGAMTMAYDAAGRRTGLTWPDGFSVQYSYDLANEMTGISRPGPVSIVGYAYDNLGRRTAVSRGNGVSTAYGYDGVSRLTSLSHDLPGTANDQSWTYGYNPAGQVITQSQANDLYAYTGRTAGLDSYTNNGLNQVTGINSAAVTYDANGNLTSDGVHGYAYNAVNQLTSTNAGASTLTYDALGRLQEMVGTNGARYEYDGLSLAAAIPTGSSTANVHQVAGPWPDELVVAYAGTGTSDPRWSLQDRLGSVVGVTNASGAVTAFNAYDEYGVPQPGNSGRLQYTGQMWLPDFGVYNYKARQYAPGLGRFLQTDPLGYAAGASLYGYVDADPINHVDPLGLGPDDIQIPNEWFCSWAGTARNPYQELVSCRVSAWESIDLSTLTSHYGTGGTGTGGGSSGSDVRYRQAECRVSQRDRDVGRASILPDGYWGSQGALSVVSVAGFSVNVTRWAHVENGIITEAFATWSFSALIGAHASVGAALVYTSSNPIGRSVAINGEFFASWSGSLGEGFVGRSQTFGVGGTAGYGASGGGVVVRPLGCTTTLRR